MSEVQQPIYAIDYGTSNSLLSTVSSTGVSEPLALDPSASDPTIFRSVLYFINANKCFYGHEAIKEYNLNAGEGRFIRSVKKFLPSKSFTGTFIDNRVVRLEDLIGYFLLEMRKRANEINQMDVTDVILGRPAKFSLREEEDRMAEYRLKKAAEFAGFKNIQFLPEPIAAAFDLRKQLTKEKIVLVVDLGGGTSDFTVIKIGPFAYKEEHLLALGGISIAGDILDGQLMKSQIAPYFGSEVTYKVPLGRNVLTMPPTLKDSLSSPADIVQLLGNDLFRFFKEVKEWSLNDSDKEKLHRLEVLVEDQLGFSIYEEVTRCKIGLSEQENIGFRFAYPEINIQHNISKHSFEGNISDKVKDIMTCMMDVIQKAQLTSNDIDIVYCTGGTSKLKYIQQQLNNIFGADKMHGSNSFHSVIQGLSHRAQEIFF